MIRKIINGQYFLLPGDLVVTKKALKITTILGSCVSVCLFDPVKKIAGMNHYLLPSNAYDDKEIFKYGDTSLEFMLHKMLNLGAEIQNIIASVFGGSSMFSNQKHRFNIGRQNIVIALDFLKHKNIIVKLHETGGNTGRRIVFHSNSGNINFKLIGHRENYSG